MWKRLNKNFVIFQTSTDVPVDEEHIADINDKKRYNPQILELKPNVHLISPGHHSSGGSSHHSSSLHSSSHHISSSNQAYKPLKFRPTIEIKDFKPSYLTSQSDVSVGSPQSQPQTPKPTYKPGTVLIKKPEIKKVKLVTPGLKHYATVKHVNRNDYTNYFRSRSAQEDQREAMVRGIYKRQSRTLVPRYAPNVQNWENKNFRNLKW